MNFPRYPYIAIVSVQHIKDWGEPEEAIFCELPQLLLDVSELWVASVSWSGSHAAVAELLPQLPRHLVVTEGPTSLSVILLGLGLSWIYLEP